MTLPAAWRGVSPYDAPSLDDWRGCPDSRSHFHRLSDSLYALSAVGPSRAGKESESFLLPATRHASRLGIATTQGVCVASFGTIGLSPSWGAFIVGAGMFFVSLAFLACEKGA